MSRTLTNAMKLVRMAMAIVALMGGATGQASDKPEVFATLIVERGPWPYANSGLINIYIAEWSEVPVSAGFEEEVQFFNEKEKHGVVKGTIEKIGAIENGGFINDSTRELSIPIKSLDKEYVILFKFSDRNSEYEFSSHFLSPGCVLKLRLREDGLLKLGFLCEGILLSEGRKGFRQGIWERKSSATILQSVNLKSEFLEREIASEIVETLPGIKRSKKVERMVEHSVTITDTKSIEVGIKASASLPYLTELSGEIRGKLEKAIGHQYKQTETIGDTLEIDGSILPKVRVNWVQQYRSGTAKVTIDGKDVSLPFEFGEKVVLKTVKCE